MRIIIIKKNGKLFVKDYLCDKNGDYSPFYKEVGNIKKYLGCELEVEEGTKFGTFFNLIAKEKDFINMVFYEELRGRKFEGYRYNDMQDPKTDQEELKMDYVELSKSFDLLNEDDFNAIDLATIFIGVGKIDEYNVFFPLSICSFNELKDKELVVNNHVEVFKEHICPDDEDDEDDCSMGTVFMYETKITLYEAIQSIIFELFFYENEEEKAKNREEKNVVGACRLKLQLLENNLVNYIEEENYEKASETKAEIDRLKKKIKFSKK